MLRARTSWQLNLVLCASERPRVNWEAFGAIAEFIGSVAVIITLLFLIAQIRHNSKQLESANSWAMTQGLMQINSEISSDSELSDIWLRGSESLSNLNESEIAGFRSHAWTRWNVALYAYEHQGSAAFRHYFDVLAEMIAQSPGLREVYESAEDITPPELYRTLMSTGT